MKTLKALVILLISFCFVVPAIGADEDVEKVFTGGWVKLYKDDTMVNAERIVPYYSRQLKTYTPDKFSFVYEGELTEVLFTKIKKLERMSALKKRVHNKSYLIRMTMRSGQVYKIYANMPNIEVRYIDPFDGVPKFKKIKWGNIETINFMEKLGGIKRCPKCGKEFHVGYVYCPYDGTDMDYVNWKE